MRLIGYVVALSILVSPVRAEESKPFVRPGEGILAGLGIESVECDAAEKARYVDHIAVSCGTTDQSFKSIKKIWRKAVRRGPLADTVRWDGAPWRDTTETEKTMYVLGGVPVAVSIDFASGVVGVRWPESYPGCHTGFEFAWFTAATDILSPVATRRENPDYPEQARAQRTGGTVIGSFLVDGTGRVLDVCVVAAHPRGLGFEQAMVEAYMRASYEPATRGGEPIAVAAPIATEFHTVPGGSWSSVLAQAWFESARVTFSN